MPTMKGYPDDGQIDGRKHRGGKHGLAGVEEKNIQPMSSQAGPKNNPSKSGKKGSGKIGSSPSSKSTGY